MSTLAAEALTGIGPSGLLHRRKSAALRLDRYRFLLLLRFILINLTGFALLAAAWMQGWIAQILAADHLITPDDLPEGIVERSAPVAAGGADPRHLREVERRHIQEVLRQEGGNKVHAARALGISRRALYRLIEKYGLG